MCQNGGKINILNYNEITVSAAYAVIGVDWHLLISAPKGDGEVKPGPQDCDVVL